MSSFQYCCNTILTPGNPLLTYNSYGCCNILTPAVYTGGNSSTPATINLPLSCNNVNCTAYTPICFTPSSTNLCGYIQGIDQALCTINTKINAPQSITCSSINMTGMVGCCGNVIPPQSLCTWAASINTEICNIEKWLEDNQTGCLVVGPTGGGGTSARSYVIDGGKGTFSGANTTSGITTSNGTIISDTSIVHGTSVNSLRLTSVSGSTFSISTSTPIQVYQGNIYHARGFVYINSSNIQSSVHFSVIVNGTGLTYQNVRATTPEATAGEWVSFSVFFVPNANQTVTLTIQGDGSTAGNYVNFADLVLEPMVYTNGGPNFEYELMQIKPFQTTYNSIASSFVPSNNITTSGLFATLGIDKIIFNGSPIFTAQQTIGLPVNNDNYVYYDTWDNIYTVKSVAVSGTQPSTDSTAILMYKLTTNGSVVATTTNLFTSQPFNGTSIQSGTITGTQIANATIADANLTATGVTANTYGSTTVVPILTVNSQGRITTMSTSNIAFPVTSVNSLTGAVSLGLTNLTGVVLTTPSNGQYLKYNGTNWVNSSITPSYYQTILSTISTVMTQRPNLNFTGYFTLTDDNSNNCTTVDITANSLTYDRIQQTNSVYVLLGNPTNTAAANVQQIRLQASLAFSSNQIGLNAIVDSQSGSSYNIPTTDITGTAYVLMSDNTARTAVLPAANAIPIGLKVTIKDTSGGTSGITVSVSGGGNIDGATTYAFSVAYAAKSFVSDGTQYWSL